MVYVYESQPILKSETLWANNIIFCKNEKVWIFVRNYDWRTSHSKVW